MLISPLALVFLLLIAVDLVDAAAQINVQLCCEPYEPLLLSFSTLHLSTFHLPLITQMCSVYNRTIVRR